MSVRARRGLYFRFQRVSTAFRAEYLQIPSSLVRAADRLVSIRNENTAERTIFRYVLLFVHKLGLEI